MAACGCFQRTWYFKFSILKYYPVKVSQNCFCFFSCSNQTGMPVSKFKFVLGKKKVDLKFP